jgi:hypothetical protein
MARLLLPLTLVALTAAAPSGAAPRLPPDVEAFRRDRETCQHFMGEEGYDADRAAYIRAQIARTCTGSDGKLAALRKKYARNRAVLRTLARYDTRIER